jgi:hypothetical protein
MFFIFDKTILLRVDTKIPFFGAQTAAQRIHTVGFNLPKRVFGADRARQTRSRACAQPRARAAHLRYRPGTAGDLSDWAGVCARMRSFLLPHARATIFGNLARFTLEDGFRFDAQWKAKKSLELHF